MNKEEIININQLIETSKEYLTLDGRVRVFERKLKLRAEDMEEPSDPEPFTKDYLIKPIIDLLKLKTLSERKFKIWGKERKVDYSVENNKKKKVLIEAKPLNDDLFKESKNGAVNQVKEMFLLAEVKENYDFGIATDGIKWVFITKTRNIADIFDIRVDFHQIKERIVGIKRITSPKEEQAITKKFYNWYDAILHGGVYFDNENKQKRISKQDCLINNIIRITDQRESEEVAQILVNRLIFLKFLQSKNIIKEDILEYISSLEGLQIFHKLEDLFFRVMNAKNVERIKGLDEKFREIPFLNGSLFLRSNIEKRHPDYTVRPEVLKELLEFINSFKFIHKEVVVDALNPEILGFIFEKAMTASERKSTGAYYTPKDVTKYISEQTIYTWLIKKANLYLKKIGYKKEELIKDINDLYIKPNPPSIKIIINKILGNIKICDNACGSGAFLLSAAATILGIYKNALDVIKVDYSEVEIKKRIVKYNIYGIDLNPNAVEIARLRLWLWVTDSFDTENVEPLPNIDFNLRVGNSLVGLVEKRIKIKDQALVIDNIYKSELEKYSSLIQKYKEGYDETETRKMEIDELNKNMKIQFDNWYLSTVDWDIEELLDSIDSLRTSLKNSRDLKANLSIEFNEEISIKLKELLEDEGFRVFKYKANSKFNYREYNPDTWEQILIKIKGSFKKAIFKRKIARKDINKLKSFHWVMEFPLLYLKRKKPFDILIGNPPYGRDVLTEIEKSILASYKTSGCNDVCGYFLEREIALARQNAMIGNIIAGSIFVNEKMTSVRDLMREKGEFKMAFFGTRPSKLFPDNEKRVALVIGNLEKSSPIKSSDNFRFTSEQREYIFSNIGYKTTRGLLLGSKIGVRESNQNTRLPKIGSIVKRNILLKLKAVSLAFRTIKEVVVDEGQISFEFRKSAGYWIHALNDFPYQSSKIERLFFSSVVERDFVLIILNSSLFYLYWTTYGNNRDLQKGLIEPFPVPSQKRLEKNKDEIIEMARLINEHQLKVFKSSTGRTGEFSSGKCKDILDRSDDLLSTFYGLSEKEKKYIINYHSHVRKSD